METSKCEHTRAEPLAIPGREPPTEPVMRGLVAALLATLIRFLEPSGEDSISRAALTIMLESRATTLDYRAISKRSFLSSAPNAHAGYSSIRLLVTTLLRRQFMDRLTSHTSSLATEVKQPPELVAVTA